jgi:hypothetical protein
MIIPRLVREGLASLPKYFILLGGVLFNRNLSSCFNFFVRLQSQEKGDLVRFHDLCSQQTKKLDVFVTVGRRKKVTLESFFHGCQDRVKYELKQV